MFVSVSGVYVRGVPAALLQVSLAAANSPLLLVQVRPDGDVELPEEAYESFVTPSCDCCGGMLKPAVVFHGDNVPVAVAEAAAAVGGVGVPGCVAVTCSTLVL